MHTYIKQADTVFTIGYWLVSGAKYDAAFKPLFDVRSRVHAISAVSMLNGSSGVLLDPLPFEITKDYTEAL